MRQILKDLDELVNDGIINSETAHSIEAYYQREHPPQPNRLINIFAILGALLIGLGIILVIGHNWDTLSIELKSILAFLPLICGQAFAAYALFKRPTKTASIESSSTFLILAIGACIALISQIYQIQGSMDSFLLSWTLLALPVVYIMRSNVASVLYLVGVTGFAIANGVNDWEAYERLIFWGLFIALLPYLYRLATKEAETSFFSYFTRLLPISLSICIPVIIGDFDEWSPILYLGLFNLFYLIGNLPIFGAINLRGNGFKILGWLGINGLLLAMSFDAYWKNLIEHSFEFDRLTSSIQFGYLVVILIAYILLLAYQIKSYGWKNLGPNSAILPVFLLLYLFGNISDGATILANILVLGIGILTLREGEAKNHLGILNSGLMLIMALVICRFFDSQLSFALRGLAFVTVGVGFFIMNYRLINKRRNHE